MVQTIPKANMCFLKSCAFVKNAVRFIIMPFIIVWRVLIIPITLYKLKKAKKKLK